MTDAPAPAHGNVEKIIAGKIAKVRDLNLTLVSVSRIEADRSLGGKDENSK